MSLLASTHVINRRALLLFISILMAVVSAAIFTMAVSQRHYLRTEAEEELRAEMKLLGDLAMDALLRSDYAAAEALIIRWVGQHDYILHINATMPNGYVLANIKKEADPIVPLEITSPVVFNGKTLMTIHVISDFTLSETGYGSIIIRVSIVLFAAIFLLGWLLWWTLQRTAIKPLEQQIISREEKEHDLMLRTANLEVALKELDSFSYSISHDLRAPLRAIDGYGHALVEDYGKALDDTAHDYVARIRGAAQRMGVLIDDLLALSRMARHEFRSTDVNMSSLANDTLDRLALAEPWRNVEAKVEGNVIVKGDPSLLGIVIDNIIQNAWKYTSPVEHPIIEFGIRTQDGETIYFVRDNGVGFDMRYADKLFKPFQRLHPTHEFPGSGIGLATVARIIQRHGGRIWAEGEKGKGATFSFTLKATPA